MSLDVQQGKKPSRMAWEWGKEVMAAGRSQGRETPGMVLFLSYSEEALFEEIRVKNSQGMDPVPRAP